MGDNSSYSEFGLSLDHYNYIKHLFDLDDDISSLCKFYYYELKLCPRCCFKYLKINNSKLFKEPIDILLKILWFLINKGKFENNSPITLNHDVCRTCIGLLQQLDDNSFLQSIIDRKDEVGYQINSYTLSLSIPTNIHIRHYQFWYFIQKKFPKFKFLTAQPSDGCFPELKDIFKWYIGQILSMNYQLNYDFSSKFEIKLGFTHEETQFEFLKIFPEQDRKEYEDMMLKAQDIQEPPLKMRKFRGRKKTKPLMNSLNQVLTRIKSLNSDSFLSYFDHQYPSDIFTHMKVEITFQHQSIYIAGRYLKYKRDIPQSEWIIDGSRHGNLSVEEFIGPHILSKTKGDKFVFSASGREDMDVRMLGRGRPFIMEVINPKIPQLTDEEYHTLQDLINEKAEKNIWVLDLQGIKDDERAILKDGETNKKKCYRAVAWVPKPITKEDLKVFEGIKDLKLDQKTPIRVLHRRSLAVREKMIHSIHCEYVNEHLMIVDLITQSGTYVKEFVHGDLGRTKPSFCEILNQEEADILLLDVVNIDLDWPKRIEGREEPPEADSIIDGLKL